MIKFSLDDPVSIPNDLPIYNVVKVDWKQNPQPYTHCSVTLEEKWAKLQLTKYKSHCT